MDQAPVAAEVAVMPQTGRQERSIRNIIGTKNPATDPWETNDRVSPVPAPHGGREHKRTRARPFRQVPVSLSAPELGRLRVDGCQMVAGAHRYRECSEQGA